MERAQWAVERAAIGEKGAADTVVWKDSGKAVEYPVKHILDQKSTLDFMYNLKEPGEFVSRRVIASERSRSPRPILAKGSAASVGGGLVLGPALSSLIQVE